MGMFSAVEDVIEQKLLDFNVAFIAKVTGVNKGRYTVQPLTMQKQFGENPTQHAVLENIPCLRTVYKIELFEFEGTESKHPSHKHGGHVRLIPIGVGDVVMCLCCDRTISSELNGSMAVPPAGHHEIKDAIIIGVLSDW